MHACRYVLCTMPLGYLQANHASIFTPALPAAKSSALKALRMGILNKVRYGLYRGLYCGLYISMYCDQMHSLHCVRCGGVCLCRGRLWHSTGRSGAVCGCTGCALAARSRAAQLQLAALAFCMPLAVTGSLMAVAHGCHLWPPAQGFKACSAVPYSVVQCSTVAPISFGLLGQGPKVLPACMPAADHHDLPQRVVGQRAQGGRAGGWVGALTGHGHGSPGWVRALTGRPPIASKQAGP